MLGCSRAGAGALVFSAQTADLLFGIRRSPTWCSALLGGVVFFAFVVDAYSRRVTGWQPASHMRTTLVLDALRMALGQRRPGADLALIHHSYRGSQYTSVDYTQTLADHAGACMGRLGG